MTISQKSHTMHDDQMVYEESSDQEQGKPSVSSPPTQIVRENRKRTSISNHSLQEETFENEAIERWLDDGGSEARRWLMHA